MYVIQDSVECLTEVKRSKFLTHLIPISEYSTALIASLKAQHPKANHVVYALRYLNEFDQIVENSSDDGEPKGSAGVPALNVLRGQELINCAVLIVRYFGGTKLGVGGLARAYALSVKEVIGVSQLSEYVKEVTYTFQTSYSQIDKTLHTLKGLEIYLITRHFGVESVSWEIIASEKKIAHFKEI